MNDLFDEATVLIPNKDPSMRSIESIDILEAWVGIEIGEGEVVAGNFKGTAVSPAEEASDSGGIRSDEEGFVDGES